MLRGQADVKDNTNLQTQEWGAQNTFLLPPLTGLSSPENTQVTPGGDPVKSGLGQKLSEHLQAEPVTSGLRCLPLGFDSHANGEDPDLY